MEITYQKSMEVRYDVDVFVAGGGPAGVAAAVACARQGRSVFVAESFSAFGGAATTMLVPAFMTFGNGVFMAEGIGREVYTKLEEQSFPRFRKYCPKNIPVETLKRIYDDMMDDCGAGYLFYTNLIDAVVANGKIQYVICSEKSSLFAVKAKQYIDCTGDGALSYFAGAEYEYGNENGQVMATTLCGIWSGIDWSRVVNPDNRELDAAFRDGVFTNEDRHLPGIWQLMEHSTNERGETIPDGVGGSNAGHVYDIDSTSSESLTRGSVLGRKQLLEYRRYFREYLTGYENAELLITAPHLGIRESRRICCDYRMTVEDYIGRANFDDEIGRYCYPIDIHSPTNDAAGYQKFITEHTNMRLKSGESYGIPYRAMVVKGLSNLLVAGRAVCCDRYMQSSIRVMPGCYITGQAAGMAAAIACDSHTDDLRQIDTHELQTRLVKMGAYLPNYTA